MLETLLLPGIWVGAGMTGAVVGLDWRAALAAARAFRPRIDSRVAALLLRIGEQGALAGLARRADATED